MLEDPELFAAIEAMLFVSGEPVAIPDTRAQPLRFNTKATALIQVNFAFSKVQAYKVTSVGIR